MAAGSGVATFGISGSPGVPDDIARCTVSIEYNDLEVLEQTIQQIGGDKVAAVIDTITNKEAIEVNQAS